MGFSVSLNYGLKICLVMVVLVEAMGSHDVWPTIKVTYTGRRCCEARRFYLIERLLGVTTHRHIFIYLRREESVT
ncbi:hypothetical protein BDY19DRAFT_960500 [Irpex rosettiformis]|uniref:Uncharacterized protein n=1 Tax=Irpex rosettiformis TaxID=378272 RepID=A0ACB8TWX3_9APHY|nr:hypothetical protein BDY19DRAFT_960500 [Irpex rosettiformis]